MKNKEKDNRVIWKKTSVVTIVAILCCALWGSAFPAIKMGYEWFEIPSSASATQILFAGCRFTLAGILTIIIGSIMSKAPLLPRKSSWKKIVILSFCQTSIHYVCFYIGLAHTTGVKSSILNGVNVFVAILISALVFRQEKLTWVKMLGSFLGFIGIVLVNLNGSGLNFDFQLKGEGMILLSTFCYGMSSALIRLFGQKENSVMLSGYQFAFGGLVMILTGVLLGGKLDVWKGKGIAILIYLAFVSAIAYTLWALLLRYNDVSKVTIFGFFNPVFGAILSALFLNESGQSFGMKEVVALLLISIGIYMVQKMRWSGTDETN
ncbi:MAG: DMT family transporter [Lachnospiraceae bacterium]|nr:DMT family transporter [Lachnospiraceae bacterium]